MLEMKIRITLTEEMLGTANSDPEIHDNFIASKAPDAPSIKEEIEAVGVGNVVEKGMTIFPRDESGDPILWNYQIKGFFKDACGMLRRSPFTKSKGLTSYKKEIDGLVFVKERKIPIHNFGRVGDCQRPLRTSTPQGERVALAHSETVAAGSTLDCTIQVMRPALKALVEEWLDYGEIRGLGQWRNSGKGTFEWAIINDWTEVEDKSERKFVEVTT